MVGININYFEYDRARTFPHLDNFSCRHRQGKHSKPCSVCREDYGKLFENPRYFVTSGPSSSFKECEKKCGVGRNFYTWKDEEGNKTIEEKWEDKHICYDNEEEGSFRQRIIEKEHVLYDGGTYVGCDGKPCTREVFVAELEEFKKKGLVECPNCSKLVISYKYKTYRFSDPELDSLQQRNLCKVCMKEGNEKGGYFKCSKCEQRCKSIFKVEGKDLCETCYNQRDNPPPNNSLNKLNDSCWIRCNKCKKLTLWNYLNGIKFFHCDNCLKNCSKCYFKKNEDGTCLTNHCQDCKKEVIQNLDSQIVKPSIEEVKDYWLSKEDRFGFKEVYYLNNDKYLIVKFDKTDKLDRTIYIYATNPENGLFLGGYKDIKNASSLLLEEAKEVKSKIKQLLSKLNVKVNQLSKKFWDWEKQIEQIISRNSENVDEKLEKLEKLEKAMFKEIEQKHNASTTQPTSDKKGLIIALSIGGGLIVFGGLILLIIKRTKKKTKVRK